MSRTGLPCRGIRNGSLPVAALPPIALSILALLAAACGPESRRGAEEPADLVLRGGRVVTVDDSLPEAVAVAVRGSEIVAVAIGDSEEIDSLIGPATRIIELEGRLAIPGFIEGHGHFLGLGNAETILDLRQAASWDEIVAMVAEAAKTAAPGEWIRGRGWHQEKWDSPPQPSVDGSPVHASLSASSPDHPVILTHASGHASMVNAKALELSGLDRKSADPRGGQLVRDPRHPDGELTGLLRETAQGLVREAYDRSQEGKSLEEKEAELRRQVELAGREALAKGVTSFQDAGSPFKTIDFFRRLEEEGTLPVRLYVMVQGESIEELDRELPAYRMEAEGNDFLAVRSIKRVIDGALGSHGAWLLEPYLDMPSTVGLVIEPEEEIAATAEIAIRHGYQVNTHAIGDRGNRRVLDLYEQAFSAGGNPPDLRWRIEHAQHLHPDDIGRFSGLGVIASMQAVHCTSDGPWVPSRIGGQRAASGAYLWRSLLDSGAVVSNGTDVPVEDIDPIANFFSAVTRRMNNGEAFYPGQRMTREEALRATTLANAYAAFEEELKGSITKGKLADIVVLSKDILTIPEEEIPEARVDLTIVGGEVRYEREGE